MRWLLIVLACVVSAACTTTTPAPKGCGCTDAICGPCGFCIDSCHCLYTDCHAPGDLAWEQPDFQQGPLPQPDFAMPLDMSAPPTDG